MSYDQVDHAQSVAPEASDLQNDAIAELKAVLEDNAPSTSRIASAVKANKSLVRPLRDEAYVPGTPPQQAEFLLALAVACLCAHTCDNVNSYADGLRRRAARSSGYSKALAIEYHLIALRCMHRLLSTGQIKRSNGRTSSEATHLGNEIFIQELDAAIEAAQGL